MPVPPYTVEHEARPVAVLAMVPRFTANLFAPEHWTRLRALCEVPDAEPLVTFADARAERLLSQGRLTFGWDAPLTVAGEEVPITDYPRRDNPWAHTEYADRTTEIEVDGYRVTLDFAAGSRIVGAP